VRQAQAGLEMERKVFIFLLPELFLSTQLLPVPHIIIIIVPNNDSCKNKFLKADLLISFITHFDQPSLAVGRV
jgi:hypothetical protein